MLKKIIKITLKIHAYLSNFNVVDFDRGYLCTKSLK